MNQRIKRLTGLARVRGFEEDQAAAVLARKARDRDAAHRICVDAEQRLCSSGFPTEMDSMSFKAIVAARAAATSDFTSALLIANEAEAAAIAAREDWHRARTRKKIVEKLVNKQVSQEEHDQLTKEQKTIDEIAVRMCTIPRGDVEQLGRRS
jgi:hypothetical protein